MNNRLEITKQIQELEETKQNLLQELQKLPKHGFHIDDVQYIELSDGKKLTNIRLESVLVLKPLTRECEIKITGTMED